MPLAFVSHLFLVVTGTIADILHKHMTPPQFIVSDTWKAQYPGAVVGILAMRDVRNPESHPAIETLKREKEDELRAQFAGQDRTALKNLDPIKAYEAYYGKYGKTYHVLLQLESIALKGKPFASTGALVQVMFVAEVGNLILTAGHDLDTMVPPLTLDIAKGTESYMLYHGKLQSPKQGDMMISDAEGITSSIVLGPDQRTRIHAGTRNVLFAAYAPVGIGKEAMRKHMEEIQHGTMLIAPEAVTELLEVYEA
jgi:DNA/RNA-binding domain of Phe-tRNA-synthetase-like protein